MDSEKVFSKVKWLEDIEVDLTRGVLSQREVDDACILWVNGLDGKSYSEIIEGGCSFAMLKDNWFI